MNRFALLISMAAVTAAIAPGVAQEQSSWKPVDGPLMTRWAKEVSPDNVLPEYPRPQLVRREWQNLNGLWEYAIRPKDGATPTQFDGPIMVPFAVESSLSGVARRVGETNRLWYRRAFDRPALPPGGRLLLHFGAVDWHAVVWINGQKVGEHRGGYDPFSFDITDALKTDGPQELVVGVWDPTDSSTQPRGKQIREPGGIWYTPVTGIWQTVWLEPVPAVYVRSLRITPDIDRGEVRITLDTVGPIDDAQIWATALDGDREIATTKGRIGDELVLKIPDTKLWSPDSPFLYGLRVGMAGKATDAVDTVESYFGMRKISLGKDAAGHTRLLLNNRPLFQYGPLDQGWWPDGLYTAPTDEALRHDIEVTRQLGFNMIRKHVKVEPQRWYYHCDRLGMLVWQDMPNGNLPRNVPNNLWVDATDAED
ncbi:MAG TPA: glycoside hydrolase family 2, partial [Thermoguttaceae bacterium]|nr:glycoside hydrolase family 2 [Thermoguttaceae bacterium]